LLAQCCIITGQALLDAAVAVRRLPGNLENGWQWLARGVTADHRLADLRARTVDLTVSAVAVGLVFAAGMATLHDLGFAVESGGSPPLAHRSGPPSR